MENLSTFEKVAISSIAVFVYLYVVYHWSMVQIVVGLELTWNIGGEPYHRDYAKVALSIALIGMARVVDKYAPHI